MLPPPLLLPVSRLCLERMNEQEFDWCIEQTLLPLKRQGFEYDIR